ncbi:uncharacterized protein LOC120341501 [Styela clava]
MLKQDVLDIVHSKVRWYAIHQTKKVCFRLNPHLYKTEDLEGAVNELQYVPDFNETRQLESEVYGENYGRKYPTFTIRDMKEYKFWKFVAGDDWRKCSSLRVTPGSLLSSLMESYRDLEKEGKILRYTTDVYENVLTYKPHGCIRPPTSSNASIANSVYTDSTESDPKDTSGTHLELTKISFTYYGVSMSHLKKILSDAGINDVSEEQIANQNPSFNSNTKSPRNVSCLDDLTRENNPSLIESSVQLELGPDWDIEAYEYHDMTGRQRKLAKRRFTHGQVCWIGKHATQANEHKTQENTLLNPVNRRLMLEKIKEQRARSKRRIELHENVNKALKESNGAYEKWWLEQIGDPLMSTDPTFTKSQLTFFGNSWIVDGNYSASDEPIQQTIATRNGKREIQAPIVNTPAADASRPPLLVPNLPSVDIWRCGCDVCNGNLLNFSGSIENRGQLGGVTSRSQGQGGRIQRKVTEEHIDVQCEKVVEVVTEEHSNNDKDITIIKKPKKTPATKKKKGKKSKKKTSEKPKLNPQIWWETVSTYTTPKWKTSEDPEQVNAKKKKSSKSKKSPMAQKLNVSYSFDKLRHKKSSVAVKQIDGTGDRIRLSSRKGSTGMESRSNKSATTSTPVSEPSDHLNMCALMTHHIIYKHTPAQCTPYTKIKLPALRSMCQPSSPKRTATFSPDVQIAIEKGKQTEMSSAAPPDKNLPALVETPLTTSRKDEVWPENFKFGSLDAYSQKPASNIFSDDIYGDSCRAWAASDKTTLPSVASLKRRDDCYFLHHVPKNFSQLCFAGLSKFIIRFETVMTTTGYQRVESLTINRTPFCSYATRKRESNTKICK